MPLKHVDVAIPCNNKASLPIAMIYWLLVREILYLKGHIPRERQWDVLVDLFEWKDVEAEEKKGIEEERRARRYQRRAPEPVEEPAEMEEQANMADWGVATDNWADPVPAGSGWD